MFTLLKMMIDRYNAIAYTHKYIFGFEYKKVVYMVFADKDIMPYICKIDNAGRNCGKSLRFVPKTPQKIMLLPMATPLCSIKYFNEVKNTPYINKKGKETYYNRGEIFEKIVTEHFGKIWEKDKIPFTEAGDIEIDSIPYQIKYQRATFTNEATLNNLYSK